MTVYVVVAGMSYSHGPPQAVFTDRFEAREYQEELERSGDHDWAKVEEVPFDPEIDN